MVYRRSKIFSFGMILASTLLLTPFSALAQDLEQEPNDSCSTAQVLGGVALPHYVDGDLQVGDIDFYQYEGDPGAYLVANLDGIDGELPALPDPYLGLFDSNCNLLAWNDDSGSLNSELKFDVPADGVFVLAATGCCDWSFTGSSWSGSYRLSTAVAPEPAVISGRVIDAETALPLPGDSEPYASATLFRCYDLDCTSYTTINRQSTDSEGRFRFERDWYGSDLTAGIYQVEASATLYVTANTGPLEVVEEQELDVGDIALSPQTIASSVTGRVVDAVTGSALPGDAWPYAYVTLYRCLDVGCVSTQWASSQSADTEGRFLFESDYTGTPLITGWYQVHARADDYESANSEIFELTEDEDEDLGDIALVPPPITFSEIRPCGLLPPEGGECRYSVRITSNLPYELEGGAWSLVEAWGTGSEIGRTEFQPKRFQELELDTTESTVVRFRFDVPSTVSNGATICANAWVGEGEDNPYFGTLGRKDLFCIWKGYTGEFSVLSKREAKALLRNLRSQR